MPEGAHCEHCPVAPGKPCVRKCEDAARGEPHILRHIVGRSAYLEPGGEPRAGRGPSPSIPLAGDLVAALTARIGADRAAKWIGEKLGADCGCAARHEKLNRLDRKLRKWLGLL